MFFGGLEVPTICALNVSEEFDMVSGRVPDPERLTTCGLVTASSYTWSWPTRVPPMLGAKLTVTLQDAPEASVYGGAAPQFVDVCWKSPLNWKLLMCSALKVLLFVIVIVL